MGPFSLPIVGLCVALGGDVHVSTSTEFERALKSAAPGTRILLASGEYQGFSMTGPKGDVGKAVVVGAAKPGVPPVIKGGLQFTDASYFEMENLVISGAPSNGLNMDDGGTFETPSHHVVLRNIVVRDCGGRGNEDGIKLSGVNDFRLERCTVERWGRGGSAVDMVGCRRGVIDSCTIRDGSDNAAASGVQAKGGSLDVTIRSCRFEHAGQRAVNIGGSTGLAYFRPKPEGFEARNVIVEGCVFIGSQAPIAFVGVDGAIVRSNTFYRPSKWVMRILQETTEPSFVPCRGGTFARNLIAYRGADVATPVNVGPHTEPGSFTFAENYWFCMDDPRRGAPKLPTEESRAGGGSDPGFRDAARGDFRLDETSPAKGFGASDPEVLIAR